MERLRNTLIAAALTSASPAFAQETEEGGDPFEDIALGEDKPSYEEIVRESKPVSELGKAELKSAVSKGMVYTYIWSGDKDINPDFMIGDSIGYRFGGKGSRELSLFFRADKVEVDNSGEDTRILYEVPNDNSDQCYQASHYARVKLMNSKEGEKTVIVLVNPGKDFSNVSVGEQGCDLVIKTIKEKVKDSTEAKPIDPDRFIPSTASANIGVNAGNFFPYTDPISGNFEPFAFNERTGISAELALDWKPFGDKSAVSIGPDATLVLGVDGTGTATRVGGHLGLEVGRFRLALNSGLRGDSTYTPLDGIPYVGAELDTRIVNLGENLSVEAFLQAKKDFPGNYGVIDPSIGAGARFELVLPDLKPSTIAKPVKALKEVKAELLKKEEAPASEAVATPEVEEKPTISITKEPKSPRTVVFGERRGDPEKVDLETAWGYSDTLKKHLAGVRYVPADLAYKDLEQLHKKKGVGMSKDDFKRGAEAAKNIGDTVAAYDRVAAGVKLTNGGKEFLDWQNEIETNYGEVEIIVPESLRGTFEGPPEGFYLLDQRLAFFRAKEIIERTGKFEGFLPVAEYKIGGQTFTIENLKSGQKFKVLVK